MNKLSLGYFGLVFNQSDLKYQKFKQNLIHTNVNSHINYAGLRSWIIFYPTYFL